MTSNWLNKIQQHEAAPPEGAWENIAAYLDDEAAGDTGFATKLSVFEITPPPAAQKNIFALLDAEEKKIAFEERIYNYNETAPAEVWPVIATELDKTEAKIIPLEPAQRKIRTIYLRAAAAAVIIALLSVTAWLLNRQAEEIPVTAETIPQKKEAAAPAPGNTNTNTAVAESQAEKNTVAVSSGTNAKNNISVNPDTRVAPSYIQNTELPVLAQNPVKGKKDKLQTVTGETPEDISLISSPNSYISISGPDGQSVRVSTKLSSLISYLTEKNPGVQENLDIIIKESAQWRATFAKWRDKMTNNAVAPSLANFMDIIELSNILEEKK